MEKITRKTFTDNLNSKASVFMGSLFDRNDEDISRRMENITGISPGAQRRRVAENHANYIVFTGGSRLDFNQQGTIEYFRHVNKNGVEFLIQRTAHSERDFKAEEDYWREHHQNIMTYRQQKDYIVYAI